MFLAPGAITSQALADQIRVNAAIEKELLGLAAIKGPCDQNPYPLTLPDK